MDSKLKIVGIVATCLMAVGSATAAVVLWALRVWAPPIEPTLYLASILLVFFLIGGGAWLVVTRRELVEGIGSEGVSAEERGLQRLILLTANVLLGIFALAVVAAWNLDSVRAQFVSSRASHVELEMVLGDSSPAVRLKACEQLFRRGWVFRSQQALIAALDPQPAMAAKCLETAKANDWKGFVMLSSNLNQGWSAAMMSAPSSEAQIVCEYAPWSPVMSDLAEERAELRLLECAMGAAADEVRQCCANTLAGRGKLLDLLGAADQFSPDATEKLLPGLVQHSFQSLTLPAGQQQVVATLGTDDEAMRKWSVELGCWAIDPAQAQTKMIGALFPLIEADMCGLSPDEQAEYRAPANWLRLCDQVLGDKSGKPIQQVVCVGVQDAQTLKAIDAGRVAIRRAIRAPFLQRDAKFLEIGMLAAHALGGDESAQEARRQAESDKRLVSDVMKLPPGMRQDMTVGEYRRAHLATHNQRLKDIANPMGQKKVVKALDGASGRKRAASNMAKKDLAKAMDTSREKRK